MKIASFREQGFTLLELLVALSVFAVMSTLLFEGLRFGSRVWEAVVTDTSVRSQISGAQEFLRARLEQASPSQLGFIGSSKEATFSAPAPEGGRGGNYEYSLTTLLSEGGQKDLVLRWRAKSAERSDWNVEVIAHEVTDLAITYFDASQQVWQPTWSARGLPKLVRIDVKLNGRASWPVMIVRPAVTADSDCRFDPVAMGCAA